MSYDDWKTSPPCPSCGAPNCICDDPHAGRNECDCPLSRDGCAAIDHGVKCPDEPEPSYMLGRFRVDGSWKDTVELALYPLAENITRWEIAKQCELHYE